MRTLSLSILVATLAIGLWGCETKAERVNNATAAPPVGQFGEYWYQGEAELTSYRLEQARYGAIHEGEAVLIYVTEPFSQSKQVKLDYADRAGEDAVTVMKLNFTKKFNTGIYPYSMMQSIFTPVSANQHPYTLKVSASSQEWCGHTFTQLNLLPGGQYHLSGKSYFESEGDVEQDLEPALLEDDIWTRIRINPDALPTGTLSMIPGTLFTRLRHVAIKPYAVEARLSTSGDGSTTYTLEYPELKRTLKISFGSTFPHTIEGWEETTPSGFGPNAQMLTTKATRNQRMMLDYWNKHDPEDAPLRKSLGLQP